VVNFNEVKKDATPRVPSVRIAIDPDKCIKCADCVDICPVGVYEAKKGMIEVSDAEFCCGDTCNQCVTFCQAGAITVAALCESFDMENK
jgi:NAD-dependent dihydropyrimidine dehydrogenase PreA subunit